VGDFHYFISTNLGWNASTDLEQLFIASKERDPKSSTAFVYYVPLPILSSYPIDKYAPQVKGTIQLFKHNYKTHITTFTNKEIPID